MSAFLSARDLARKPARVPGLAKGTLFGIMR